MTDDEWNRDPRTVGLVRAWAADLAAAQREAELAEALDAYTDPNSPEFDPVFNAQIRAMRPDWFPANDDGAAMPVNPQHRS